MGPTSRLTQEYKVSRNHSLSLSKALSLKLERFLYRNSTPIISRSQFPGPCSGPTHEVAKSRSQTCSGNETKYSLPFRALHHNDAANLPCVRCAFTQSNVPAVSFVPTVPSTPAVSTVPTLSIVCLLCLVCSVHVPTVSRACSVLCGLLCPMWYAYCVSVLTVSHVPTEST